MNISIVKPLLIKHALFNSLLLPPPRYKSGGNRSAASFCLLKKYASHFFNSTLAEAGKKKRLIQLPVKL